MRLPHVSSKTATVTGPREVGGTLLIGDEDRDRLEFHWSAFRCGQRSVIARSGSVLGCGVCSGRAALTKVQDIRVIDDGVDGHDIDATVPGFGRMQLKSSVVRKLG